MGKKAPIRDTSIEVRLCASTKRELARACAARGETVSDFVRRVCVEEFDRRGSRRRLVRDLGAEE